MVGVPLAAMQTQKQHYLLRSSASKHQVACHAVRATPPGSHTPKFPQLSQLQQRLQQSGAVQQMGARKQRNRRLPRRVQRRAPLVW